MFVNFVRLINRKVEMFYILLILSAIMAFAPAQSAERKFEIYNSKTGEKIDVKKMAELSQNYDVIFFGEFHDDSIIHTIQKDYLEAMLKANPKTAVSMEMFERDVQNIIDDFLSDKINEEEFLKKSRPWPEYKDSYKPLVELAKASKMPVIAANIPRKYASVYSVGGMSGINKLPADERKLVARELNIKVDEYLYNFYKVMKQNLGLDSNAVVSANQENTLYLYYGAQVLKDETMGESIYDFLIANKDMKVIHFNGDFHSNDYLGTVQKLTDRSKNTRVAVITPIYVDKGKDPDYEPNEMAHSDFQIVMEEKPQPPELFPLRMGGHLGENFAISHKIRIELNPEKNYLEGSDEIILKNPMLVKGSIHILKSLKVTEVSSPQAKINYKIESLKDDSLYQEILITPVSNNIEITELYVTYKGTVYNSPNELQLNQRHSNSAGIISSAKGEGIYLPGGSYYPQTNKDIADFDIQVKLPKGQTIITSGKLEAVIDEDKTQTFVYKSELAADDFILVGGKYIEKTEMYDGKKFSVYTFSDTVNAAKYLSASIEYYQLYTKLLGPYPYSSFSVVENFFATGFGMPGYTLLSSKLMALPWVTLTPGSLAHEFVHNWWGNSVFTDYAIGNWCEALTTYCSNYYYNVLKNNQAGALDWRKKSLVSIANLPEAKNYPVIKFKYQSNNDDATIGYQKGGFIFYEIMKLIGQDRFFRGLQSFATKFKGKKAQWRDLGASFDEQVKKDSLKIPVKKALNQWLNDQKIPLMKLTSAKMDGDSLRIEITEDPDFLLSAPIEITTDLGKEIQYVTLGKFTNNVALKVNGKVKSVQLDPNYEILRHLNKWEIPYSFNQTLGDKPLMIIPSKISADYTNSEGLAKMMIEGEYNIEYKSVDNLHDSDWKERSLIVLGNNSSNKFFANLAGKYPKDVDIQTADLIIQGKKTPVEGNILLMSMGHPTNIDKFVTVIHTDNMSSLDPFKRLFRYLSYSLALLNKSKSGMPQAQMEIFPANADKQDLLRLVE
jgi:aminopeptidase N